MKFCKDCKHCNVITIGNYKAAHLCQWRPLKYHLITGETMYERYDCAIERNSGWLLSRLGNKCGREGRFF